MSPLYIFLHLAKTGGTTFVGHLYKNMKFDEEFVDLGVHGNAYRKENKRPELQERPQKDLDKIKIIAGHLVYWELLDLFPAREKKLIFFLRLPIPRVISHYTFDTSIIEKPFSEWYKSWIPNQTFAFLCDHLRVTSIDEILTKLEQFWHIGFTENLDISLTHIYTQLGMDSNYKNRRVAGEKENSTKELGYDLARIIKPIYKPTLEELEQIEADHKIDTWLYTHINENTVNGKYTRPSGLNTQLDCLITPL